ncbi:MAG: AMP-dependent synthetase, partial [Pseudomonadota bacterium]
MDLFFGKGSRPEAPALIGTSGDVVTWDALCHQISDIATLLGPERRLVAIEAHQTIDTLIAYLGALSAGHAVAMLPPSDARAWTAFERDFSPDAAYRGPGEGWDIYDLPAGEDRPPLHPDLALLLSTSGSTGESKF